MPILVVDDGLALYNRVAEALALDSELREIPIRARLRYAWEIPEALDDLEQATDGEETANAEPTVVICDLYGGLDYFDLRAKDPRSRNVPISPLDVPSRESDDLYDIARAAIDNVKCFVAPVAKRPGWRTIAFTHVVPALQASARSTDIDPQVAEIHGRLATEILNLLEKVGVQYVAKSDMIAGPKDLTSLVYAVKSALGREG